MLGISLVVGLVIVGVETVCLGTPVVILAGEFEFVQLARPSVIPAAITISTIPFLYLNCSSYA